VTDPHHSPTAAADNPNAGHETSDVNIRAILGFGLGLLIAALFIHFMVWVLFEYLQARATARMRPEYPLAVGEGQRVPPEPRLQTNPREDLRELREAEDRILTTYGWVDRNAGAVRIPIEQAMKVVVQRGLPARQENNVNTNSKR